MRCLFHGWGRGLYRATCVLAFAGILGVLTVLTSCAADRLHGERRVAAPGYVSPSQCALCHRGIFEQYERSMHAWSYTNPVFQAQYFGELIAQAEDEPSLMDDATGCIRCHSPVVALTREEAVTAKDQIPSVDSGITCDFCHTLTGYKKGGPGGGDYISSPGDTKRGPLRCQTKWHHKYSGFHRRSEFCAVCHESRNRHGLTVKGTYTEWKESSFAARGVQCQDCHMNEIGFLMGGWAHYESGHAAETGISRSPYRERLYTHRFPGAHSLSQIIGALTVEIHPRAKTAAKGGSIVVDVIVNNTNTGHKMPTGSADIRLMWLELHAYPQDRDVLVPAVTKYGGAADYDVSGQGAFDASMLGGSVPEGCRIYRAIFIDASGKQTYSSYRAEKIIFDNRLEASEMRTETYTFEVPEDAGEQLSFQAVLNYLPYPYPFASRLGVPRPDPVEIASDRVHIDVQ